MQNTFLNNSKIDINKSLLVFFSSLFLFILSRQVPFDSLSFLMNISLLLVIGLSFRSIIGRMYGEIDLLLFFLIVFCYLSISFFYSLFLQNELPNVIRFFLILIFLSVSYFIVLPQKVLSVFIFLNIIQALFVILFSLYLCFFFSIDNYLPVRFFFQEKGWGDVFTYNGWFYRIQIKGNALLPVAYFTTYFYDIKGKKTVRLILFLGSIFAGNVAYLIAMVLFNFALFFKTNNLNKLMQRMLLLLLIISLSAWPAYKYFIKETLELKSDSSLPSRVDQVDVLMSDLSENAFYFVFGRGLGNTIEKVTAYRDYRGDVYFELQALYILNQIGFFGFGLFLFYNIYISYRLFSIWLIIFYLCYILYALTNPYIFDTNHIVVILILNIIKNNENK